MYWALGGASPTTPPTCTSMRMASSGQRRGTGPGSGTSPVDEWQGIQQGPRGHAHCTNTPGRSAVRCNRPLLVLHPLPLHYTPEDRVCACGRRRSLRQLPRRHLLDAEPRPSSAAPPPPPRQPPPPPPPLPSPHLLSLPSSPGLPPPSASTVQCSHCTVAAAGAPWTTCASTGRPGPWRPKATAPMGQTHGPSTGRPHIRKRWRRAPGHMTAGRRPHDGLHRPGTPTHEGGSGTDRRAHDRGQGQAPVHSTPAGRCRPGAVAAGTGAWRGPRHNNARWWGITDQWVKAHVHNSHGPRGTDAWPMALCNLGGAGPRTRGGPLQRKGTTAPSKARGEEGGNGTIGPGGSQRHRFAGLMVPGALAPAGGSAT